MGCFNGNCDAFQYIVTPIKEVQAEENRTNLLKAFPNPVDTDLTIEWTQNLSGKIYLTKGMGQIVRTTEISSGELLQENGVTVGTKKVIIY